MHAAEIIAGGAERSEETGEFVPRKPSVSTTVSRLLATLLYLDT
jgi:hypothetical protein